MNLKMFSMFILNELSFSVSDMLSFLFLMHFQLQIFILLLHIQTALKQCGGGMFTAVQSSYRTTSLRTEHVRYMRQQLVFLKIPGATNCLSF